MSSPGADAEVGAASAEVAAGSTATAEVAVRATATAEVAVRAADAGDTYLTWRWLDRAAQPEFAVLGAAPTDDAMARLNANLLTWADGESDAQRLTRVLRDGAFASVAGELALARATTAAVLPDRLRTQIVQRADAGMRVRFRVTPSPRLARVPWELLLADADRRVIEVAEIVQDPPATVHVNRPVLPQSWSEAASRPALYVIDPVLPRRAVQHGLRPVLDAVDRDHLGRRLGEHVANGRISRMERVKSIGYAMNRRELSTALRSPRSRLLYFGHVSATADEPGSAAIHLHDTETTWGLAAPRRHSRDGVPVANRDDHRPLAALDLLLGTILQDRDGRNATSPGTPQEGHQLWPMPPRVAVIACEGGVDYRTTELFGLVVAMINAGAGLVTTTRWALPTNRAFREVSPGFVGMPTTELALRVDAAHDTLDPVAELTRWQRTELAAWRETGDLARTPLIWASLTHAIAPARAVRTLCPRG